MDETPNFRALAELWLARDPRSEALPPEAREQIISKLAKALERRRKGVNHQHQDVGLVVNIDRDNIVPGKGLAEEAIEQLTRFLQERIDHQDES